MGDSALVQLRAITTPRPSTSAVVRMLHGVLPNAVWLLRHVEKDGYWIKFPPIVVEAIRNLKVNNYVELYGDEKHVWVAMLVGLLGEDLAKDAMKELGAATADDALALAEELGEAFEEEFEIPKTEAQIRTARAVFASLSAEDQALVIRRGQFFWSSFLAGFFQTLSVMVHGEKLTALVTQGLAGNTEAFCKAVQIDRNLLANHKGFRERLSRAHMEGDSGFLEALAYRMRNPVAKGAIRYRELWLALALLDICEYLDGRLTYGELIEMLRQAGLDLKRNGVEDEAYFGKRLKAYRRFQARSKVEMH